VIGETSCHGRCALCITAWGLLTLSGLRLVELEAQGRVWPTEMVIDAPPLEMGQQFTRELSGGPGAPRESGQGMPQGQIDAFHESGVEGAGEPEQLEPVGQAGQIAQAHAPFDPRQSAAAIRFLDLAVQQVERDLPTGLAGGDIGDPLTEMGGDGIEVEVKAINW